LVDGGANCDIAGGDVRIITKTGRVVDVTGIDNHQITNLPIISERGVTKSQRGKILVIWHQYAYVPNGKTIIQVCNLRLSRTQWMMVQSSWKEQSS